jgi:hypothetical protein
MDCGSLGANVQPLPVCLLGAEKYAAAHARRDDPLVELSKREDAALTRRCEGLMLGRCAPRGFLYYGQGDGETGLFANSMLTICDAGSGGTKLP